MAGRSSQNKGKRGEREVIKLLQPIIDRVYAEHEQLEPVKLQRNTLQSDSGGFDVVGLTWLALEVKFQEQLSINTWWKQTLKQAKQGQLPVLIYRQSRKPWKVLMLAQLPVDRFTVPHECRVELSVDDFLVFFEKMLRSQLMKECYPHENGGLPYCGQLA